MTNPEVVTKFVADFKGYIEPCDQEKFVAFVHHLVQIESPLRDISADTVMHGIVVASMGLLFSKTLSPVLLLALLGHDWDRACAEQAVRQEQFPEDQYDAYKKAHALQSAKLFCAELRKFFDDSEMIEAVGALIKIHEEGGTPDAEIIDVADAMSFFSPETTNWYRHEKVYKDKEGVPLPGVAQEERRKSGLTKKIKFMTLTLKEEHKTIIQEFIEKNSQDYSPEVLSALDTMLN
ncbi:hypothetical protein HOL46_02050 [Candidatus Falkowbacteria bacterium]|nr:hypothetical protein [Candidatus Falkowbacteria bacterium]